MARRAARISGQGQHVALTWAVVAVIALFSILPMLRLLAETVFPGGSFTLASVNSGLADPTVWRAARNTLVVGVAGTVFATALGVAFALVVTLTDVRARAPLILCFVTPLMIAPQVTALSWLQLFGPASPFLNLIGIAPRLGAPNPLYSAGGIVFLLGISYAPLVFLVLRAGLRKLPRELVEAALSSGAGWGTVVRTVVLPLMRPAIVGGAALTFVSCIGNFGIPAFLGIPANYPVLTTLIFQRLAGGGPAVLSQVAFLSSFIGMIALLGILAQNWVSARRDVRIRGTSLPAAPRPLGRARLPVEGVLWALIVVVLVLPLIGLGLSSVTPGMGIRMTWDRVSLSGYQFVMFEHQGTRRAFVNSLTLATTTATFAVLAAIPLAYVIAWGRIRWVRVLNLAVELPYALPGVVLSIAAILMFLRPLPLIGVQLYNTLWIILFAYLARFLVLAVRPTVNGFAQLDRTLEEAAQIAGAGLFTRMRTIIAPLVAPAALAGGLLVFMTAFSELTVSALLWSSGSETLGVMMFSFEQGGDSRAAAAISTLVVAATLALMLVANLFARALPQGVLPWRD